MPWVVTLENLFFAKVIREVRSRVFQDTKILNSCKNNFINNILPQLEAIKSISRPKESLRVRSKNAYLARIKPEIIEILKD